MSAPVSLAGLGLMGSALARALLVAGAPLTVWNRNLDRAEPLQAHGAIVAASFADAVSASDLTILVTSDCDALLAMIAEIGNIAGKDFINLVTASPAQIVRLERAITARGGGFLNGAVQFYPDGAGKAESSILFSGEAAVWDRWKDRLCLLGGRSQYLAGPATIPNIIDAAISGSFVHGAHAAFLEAIAYAERAGLGIDAIVDAVPQIFDALRRQIERDVAAIRAGDFSTDQATLDIYALSLRIFRRSQEEAGATSDILLGNLARMERAISGGDGAQGMAALYKY